MHVPRTITGGGQHDNNREKKCTYYSPSFSSHLSHCFTFNHDDVSMAINKAFNLVNDALNGVTKEIINEVHGVPKMILHTWESNKAGTLINPILPHHRK